MANSSYEYLGKFVVNDGHESEQEVLVISEKGHLRFVGSSLDHPGVGSSSGIWDQQLRCLPSGLGVRVVDTQYVSPAA